jgi:outer membrane protein assembly factor BamC
MNRFPILALTAVVLATAGCSLFKTDTYKSTQVKTAAPLEVPPELTSPTMDDRYSIPDPKQSTTYSAYSQRPAPGAAATPGTPAAAANPAVSAVLPKFDNVKLERHGDQRWLTVRGDPERVWPVVREFWIDSGYRLLREQPELGLMETDWYEDRAKIPQDIVRRTIGKMLDGMYSLPRRDKFRTRLEKGAEPGTTEIFVSNRNVEETLIGPEGGDSTKWVFHPADKELEAEMLTRIMAKLGGGDTKVVQASAPLPGRRGATPAAAANEPRNAVLENNGSGPLVVNDSFDRAWRRVGLALDRVGFTVEDRDRSKGLFYVRYIDPEADRQNTAQSESWTEKLKFWKSSPKNDNKPQYRIHVADAGASMSQVQVQSASGSPESSSTGRKILSLLYDQLK